MSHQRWSKPSISKRLLNFASATSKASVCNQHFDRAEFTLVQCSGVYVWAWFKPLASVQYLNILTLVTVPETIRMFIVCLIKKRTERLKGSWIIGLGMLPLLLLGAYQIFVAMGVAPILYLGYIPTPFYSMLIIMQRRR